jgi:hypothetical protein
MAQREAQFCDACADEDVETPGHLVYLGFAKSWWVLDLCDDHEVALLGGLEALLDNAGAPVSGPPLNV